MVVWRKPVGGDLNIWRACLKLVSKAIEFMIRETPVR